MVSVTSELSGVKDLCMCGVSWLLDDSIMENYFTLLHALMGNPHIIITEVTWGIST
jgi:hypothetical protein